MEPTFLDHTMTAVLAVLFPAFAALRWREMRARLRADPERWRIPAYRGTIMVQWMLTLCALTVWYAHGRDWSALGLGRIVIDTRFYIAAAAVSAVMIFFSWQLRSIRKSAEAQAQVREQVKGVSEILPQTDKQFGWFVALSITAGICEEILFRGWLYWWLSQYMPMWAALIVASVAFGAAHAYQGIGGVLKTGVAGLVFGGLYLLSGSLWLSILLHAFVDVNGGQTAMAAREPRPAAA